MGRRLALLILFVFSSSFGIGSAFGSGITYQGRLIDPAGQFVVGQSVQFKIQIRSPGSENCLFFEEVQTKDLSQSAGVFSLTINDGSGTRLDSTGLSLDQIFANKGSFNFPSGHCSSGNTWTPSSADSRKFQFAFNDGTFSSGTWE